MADGEVKACLGEVKFYGPKRDDRGQLWGYVTLLGSEWRGLELRFTETHLTSRVADDQLVRALLEGRQPRVSVASIGAVQPDPQTLRLVESTALSYRDSGQPVPDVLVSLIGALPEQAVSPSVGGLLPGTELVRRVHHAPGALVTLLRECLSWGRPIDWLGGTAVGAERDGRLTRGRSPVVSASVVLDAELSGEVVDLLLAFPRQDLARGIVARASERLISGAGSSVPTGVRPEFAAAVPPASLARMPDLLGLLTPPEQAEAILRALASPGGRGG